MQGLRRQTIHSFNSDELLLFRDLHSTHTLYMKEDQMRNNAQEINLFVFLWYRSPM